MTEPTKSPEARTESAKADSVQRVVRARHPRPPLLVAAMAAAFVAPAMLRVPLTNGDVMVVPRGDGPRNHKGQPMTKYDYEAIEKARLKRERKAAKRNAL